MRRFTFTIIAAFVALCMSAQENPMMKPLPLDPAVKVGKLDNGLTYYIRHNELPAKRVELYLATDAGAIYETPDQDGLAHFLEHMCFNGTEHFPGKSLLNWLQSIGAEFGRNINASTGFEETQYMLNNIPVERESVLDSCLMILRDYSHYVTNATDEIDAERGVIREERRQRRNAQWRTFEASLPYYFGDTKYASCTLIGSEENIMGFQPQSIHNFYASWYHPGRQAVVVVGDIDVDRTEAKIKELFGPIPAKENPETKPQIPFPANEKPVVGVITDPENTYVTVEMAWKSPAAPEAMNATTMGQVQEYIKMLVAGIMEERFKDITSKANAPFIDGSFYITSLIYEDIDAVIGEVNLKDDNILPGLEAFYTEIERMRRYGFLKDEFDRVKADLISSLETRAEKADTRKNPQLVRPLLKNFFDKYPVLDPKTDLELGKQILSMLSVDVLNQMVPQLITEDNLVVIYTGPEKESIATPKGEQLLDVIAKVKAADIQPLKGEEIASDFLDASKLKAGAVKKTAKGPYGSTVWTLKNGVTVTVLPTQHQKDQILLHLYRHGGQSLIPTEDLPSFNNAILRSFIQNCGIGQFSGTQASKMLSGKKVEMVPYINELRVGVDGNSTKKDLETAFQLMYMEYVNPRFDPEEYNVGVDQLKAVIPNIISTPNYKMQKGYYDMLYGGNPRMQLISPEVLEKANIETVKKHYTVQMGDAAGLNLLVVGDVDLDVLKPLVEKYVGSIPKGKKAPKWVDSKLDPVTGINEKRDPQKMETPQSTVFITYHAPLAWSAANEAAMDAISYIMDMRYTASLREEIGGTYGAQTWGDNNKYPKERADFNIVFQCKPELCDTLLKVAKAQFEAFANEGPSADEFSKSLLNLQKKIPEGRITNQYWVRQIRYMQEGYGDNDKDYEAAVNALTAEKVQALAKALLAAGNKIEYVMVPAE